MTALQRDTLGQKNVVFLQDEERSLEQFQRTLLREQASHADLKSGERRSMFFDADDNRLSKVQDGKVAAAIAAVETPKSKSETIPSTVTEWSALLQMTRMGAAKDDKEETMSTPTGAERDPRTDTPLPLHQLVRSMEWQSLGVTCDWLVADRSLQEMIHLSPQTRGSVRKLTLTDCSLLETSVLSHLFPAAHTVHVIDTQRESRLPLDSLRQFTKLVELHVTSPRISFAGWTLRLRRLYTDGEVEMFPDAAYIGSGPDSGVELHNYSEPPHDARLYTFLKTVNVARVSVSWSDRQTPPPLLDEACLALATAQNAFRWHSASSASTRWITVPLGEKLPKRALRELSLVSHAAGTGFVVSEMYRHWDFQDTETMTMCLPTLFATAQRHYQHPDGWSRFWNYVLNGNQSLRRLDLVVHEWNTEWVYYWMDVVLLYLARTASTQPPRKLTVRIGPLRTGTNPTPFVGCLSEYVERTNTTLRKQLERLERVAFYYEQQPLEVKRFNVMRSELLNLRTIARPDTWTQIVRLVEHQMTPSTFRQAISALVSPQKFHEITSTMQSATTAVFTSTETKHTLQLCVYSESEWWCI